MSHYKSNLHDIEFNLFEVLVRRTAWAPARTPRSTRHRPRDPPRRSSAPLSPLAAASFATPTCNPPVYDRSPAR